MPTKIDVQQVGWSETISGSISLTGNLTVAGDIIIDDGGSIKEAGGTAAITIDGSGHVTKIGQDAPSSNEVLTWDGSKAVWSASGGGAGGISHDGSTADGVLTYKDADEATVESNLTFDGSTLLASGDDIRIRINGDTDSHPGLELAENGTRKWIVYNNYANDNLTFKTNSNIRMTIAQSGLVSFTEGFEVGSDAAGDILYHNGTSYVRLAKGSADQVLTMNDGATAPNWETPSGGGSSNEYYHLTLSGRVRNTNGNLFGHAAYPYNAGDADWTTSLSSYVSNWTTGDTTFDATYANAMLYFTIGVAPAAMSLTSARIAYYMANDNMTDDYIWEIWKATPSSGTSYSTSLTWTRIGFLDRGGDPASTTYYAVNSDFSSGNTLAAGDLIGLTVHNPGDTYTSKYHGYHLVLRFTYS